MDSIADLLVRINCGIDARKESVDVQHSKMKEAILKIMMTEGFITKYDSMARLNKKYLRVGLKYAGGKKNVISGLKRISTPGRRTYVGRDRIPRVRSGYGLAIISTSKGLLTDVEAREKKLGGEVVCYIW